MGGESGSAGSRKERHAKLQQTLGLPFVLFCGLGVTVGAGIYLLIGVVTSRVGDHAPLAFLIAGPASQFGIIAGGSLSVAGHWPVEDGQPPYMS